jgi:hypothetical protein
MRLIGGRFLGTTQQNAPHRMDNGGPTVILSLRQHRLNL